MKIVGLFSALFFALFVNASGLILKGVRSNGSPCSVKIDLVTHEMGPVPSVEFYGETAFFHGDKRFSFSVKSVDTQADKIVLLGFGWQGDLITRLAINDQNKIISAVLTEKRSFLPGEETLIVCKSLE